MYKKYEQINWADKKKLQKNQDLATKSTKESSLSNTFLHAQLYKMAKEQLLSSEMDSTSWKHQA